jgi:TP901 family phage tail tape measure protein
MVANQRIYVELVADVRGFKTGISDASSQVGTLDKGLSKLQKSGLLALTTGVALAGRETLKLDTAMRNVNSISGMTEQALRATTSEVVRMSKVLPQSASTLAEGLYDIASSGFQGADGMKVLTASATAASAGMTETAVSAKAITAVLNAYKKPASEAADVSDVLFSTVNYGVTTFEQLAHNLGDYIGTAQALGVSFEETGSAVATMTLNGINATQAGTSLNAVLAKLIKPSEGLASTMRDLGYESGTAMVEALGFRGALLQIAEASGGTAEGLSKNFDDINALRGALALTNNEGSKWTEIGAKMETASARAGAAQNALAEQSKAVSYQLRLTANRAMAAGVELGNFLKPAVLAGLIELRELGGEAKDGLTAIGDGARELGQALGPTFENLQSIGVDAVRIFQQVYETAEPLSKLLATAAVGGLVVGLEAITDVLEPLVGLVAESDAAIHLLTLALIVSLIPAAMSAATVLGGSLVMAVRIATTQMAALRAGSISTAAAMSAMGGPVGVAVAAFAALGLGADYLTDRLADAPPAAGAMSKALIEFAETGQVAGAMSQVLGGDISSLKDQLDRASSSAWFSTEWSTVEVKEARGEIKALDEALAAMVQGGHADLAADAYKRLRQAQGDLSDEEFEGLFGQYRDAMDGVAASTELAAVEAEKKQKADQKLAVQQEAAAEAAKTLTDRLSEQADVLRAMFDPVFAMQKATRDHAQAQADVAAAIQKHGKNSQEANDAQWALLESTVGVTDAASRLKGAVADGTVSLGESKAQLAAWVRQGLLSQAQADVLAGEIEGVTVAADKLSLTPAVVKATDAGTVAPVLSKLQLAKERLEDLNGRTAVVTTFYRSVGMPGSAPTNRTVGVGGGLQKADGGYISGPGGPTDDLIPAMLSDGEYVVRADAVKLLGVPLLDRLNQMANASALVSLGGFASGGLVARSVPLATANPAPRGLVPTPAEVSPAEQVRALVGSW